MAKRTAKQRAAFKRMIAGLRRWKKGQRRTNAPKRRRGKARRRSRNPITYANPIAYVVNPGRPKMARKRKRRRRHNVITYSNRRRRRRHTNPRHRRRRRNNPFTYSNPVTIATTGLKKVAMLALPAIGGSFVANFTEAKFLGNQHPVVRGLVKVGMAVASGAMLRRSPDAAAATVGAIIGTLGGELGTRAGGGLIAASAKAGMKELAEMAADDGELALLMKEELSEYGLGLILAEKEGIGDDGIDQTDEAQIDQGDEDDEAA